MISGCSTGERIYAVGDSVAMAIFAVMAVSVTTATQRVFCMPGDLRRRRCPLGCDEQDGGIAVAG